MPSDPRVRVGVAAIVRRGDQILVLRRCGRSAEGAGTLCVPGGWMEFGESAGEVAVREVLEETGVDVEYDRDLGWVHHVSETWNVTLLVECSWVSGEPCEVEPEKSSDPRWIGVDELANHDLFVATRLWYEEFVR